MGTEVSVKRNCRNISFIIFLLAILAVISAIQSDPIEEVTQKRRKIDLPDFPAGAAYILSRLSNEELIILERSEPVCLAILIRPGLDPTLRWGAVAELAALRHTDEPSQALEAIRRLDKDEDVALGPLIDLARYLLASSSDELKVHRASLENLAVRGGHYHARVIGYAALILIEGVEKVWKLAESSKGGLIDLLGCVELIPDKKAREALFPYVKPLLLKAPNRAIQQAAIQASIAIPGYEMETFFTLSSFVREGIERDAAIQALLRLPVTHWQEGSLTDLIESTLEYAEEFDPTKRNTKEFKHTLQLGEELASLVQEEQARKIRGRLAPLGIRILTVRAIPQVLLYDKKVIVVEAGEAIEITFENPGIMPHNLIIVTPGSMQEIGLAANRMINHPVGRDGKRFVPDSNKVLHASRLVYPGESGTLSFVAPKTLGEYPYLCTYPGHWIQMNGIMHVVKDVNAWIGKH